MYDYTIITAIKHSKQVVTFVYYVLVINRKKALADLIFFAYA